MSKQFLFVLVLLVVLAGVVGLGVFVLTAGDLTTAGLSVLFLAAAYLAVAAIFAQPGDIRMSPEREAALATGHTDRQTLFENVWLRPALWLLLILSHRLAMPRFKDWLRRTLVAAGSPNYYTPQEYVALSLLAGVSLGVAASVLHMFFLDSLSLSWLAAGLVIGTALALNHLREKANKRIRLISKRVPYALDLIALAMGAGATFVEAVRTVVRERSDDPFSVELRTLLAEMELGTTRRKALQNLSDRIPLDVLRSIIASVVQSEDLGTPLGEVLHEQATLLRQQRSVRAENLAAVASVRILLPCLLLVMAVIIMVVAPLALQAIRGGGLF